ncbi:MAG: WbqC family protein [Chitinophagaceae bacterium]|nr:WbqC family protein [Chitinophagaceae bacterium]
MILSAHQPAYLPWLGYFDKIINSNIFVYLDSVQFEKNSFTNRNRIKTPQGATWLTVPVKIKGHIGKTLMEIEIDNSQDWRKKHLNTIFMNYKKVPRFEACYEKLEKLYQNRNPLLTELCWDQLLFWMNELGISTQIVRSSCLPIDAKKSDLVLELCRYHKADHYISGILGRNYLQVEDFARDNIAVTFQEYKHPVYPQVWGDFLPYMSILDFWMNTCEYILVTES